MEEIFSVSQVNVYIKGLFLKNSILSSISIKGEVSNCKYHGSGHIYFTLKDEGGQIACVMFSGSRSGLSFRLSEGQAVVVSGSVQVYERDGKYQLYAKEIKKAGIGLLYERFEQIKGRLAREGLFAAEHKKKIPFYPKKVGIVTAKTGAAIRDMITIASRRNPFISLVLAPATVQGESAPFSIVASMQKLERMGVDVIIVGRGGGSIEDLWAFNDELVVRAIFACTIPVISAVGHETDTTLSDYVADLRASTPSAAAELAVPEITSIQIALVDYHAEFYRAILRKLEKEKERVNSLLLRIQKNSPIHCLHQKKQWLFYQEERMQERMRQILLQKKNQMQLAVEQLRRLSPLDKLSKGYSFVSNEALQSITSIGQVKEGERLHIHVTDGEILVQVENCRKIEYERN